MQFSDFKDKTLAKKTNGVKKNKLRDIPKLDDANWAGTRKSHLCTLILTEGDSAKSMAIAGLSVVGRDQYGVFPLKGKVLNVRDATTKQIVNNSEITNIKKILGLESGKKYKDTKNVVAFLSANTWDVSGAGNFGFNAIWVNRNKNIFDKLDYIPHNEINNLNKLLELI